MPLIRPKGRVIVIIDLQVIPDVGSVADARPSENGIALTLEDARSAIFLSLFCTYRLRILVPISANQDDFLYQQIIDEEAMFMGQNGNSFAFSLPVKRKEAQPNATA